MLFTDIRLQNFRSYEDASFELSEGVNIVVGPNGAGKTSLLEAIQVAAVGKSFRAKDGYLIKKGQTWTRIDVHTNQNQTRVVKIQTKGLLRPEKTYELGTKLYKRLVSNHIQPVVLFEPNDLNLIHSEPAKRRDYLDNILEQTVLGYSKLRTDLKRIISQRNALLKTSARGESQLFAWDIRLCDVASSIIQYRLDLLRQINLELDDIYKYIAGSSKEVGLRYESKTNPGNYSANLMKQLESQRQMDFLRGYTSRGPHRDDIVGYFADEPLVSSASRGENRTLILALKIIELKILQSKTGKRPLLLLDDVFSELDGSRRRALTEYLKDYQTIITTTDADAVIKNFTSNHSLIAVG